MGFVESFKSFFKGLIKFSGTTEKMEFVWHIVIGYLTWWACGVGVLGLIASNCRRLETMGYNKWLGLINLVFPMWIVTLFLKEK